MPTGQPPQAASLQQGVASAAGQEALLARCKLIFLGDSVRASGLGAVASPSTLRAILAAELAANALWKTHEAQVRQRFAPELVAKQEVFGYLLNDMAGKQLLHSDYAMPVGQRGDNAVVKAKSQLRLKSAAATPFDGEALLGAAAVAQGCSKCAPVRAGVLTGAGMDATIVARMATAEVQALEQILRCSVQQAQQAGKRKIAAL